MFLGLSRFATILRLQSSFDFQYFTFWSCQPFPDFPLSGFLVQNVIFKFAAFLSVCPGQSVHNQNNTSLYQSNSLYSTLSHISFNQVEIRTRFYLLQSIINFVLNICVHINTLFTDSFYPFFGLRIMWTLKYKIFIKSCWRNLYIFTQEILYYCTLHILDAVAISYCLTN